MNYNDGTSAGNRCNYCGGTIFAGGTHQCSSQPALMGAAHRLCNGVQCPYCYTIPVPLREALIEIRDRQQ